MIVLIWNYLIDVFLNSVLGIITINFVKPRVLNVKYFIDFIIYC